MLNSSNVINHYDNLEILTTLPYTKVIVSYPNNDCDLKNICNILNEAEFNRIICMVNFNDLNPKKYYITSFTKDMINFSQPDNFFSSIKTRILNFNNHLVKDDYIEAVYKAIDISSNNDIVLILKKGGPKADFLKDLEIIKEYTEKLLLFYKLSFLPI